MNILSDGASGFDRDLRLATQLHVLGADQHDTTFCPRASRCELCGRSSGLAVETPVAHAVAAAAESVTSVLPARDVLGPVAPLPGAGAAAVDGEGWDVAAQTALATRAMPQFPKSASQPHTLSSDPNP